MILVDTSVWVDHLRTHDAALADLLNTGHVLTHPFVIGELALGNLRNRETILNAIQGLPQAAVADHDEVLHFIAKNTLYGLGIGYIDAHLLAATRLTTGASLWTRDKRLLAAAIRLGVASQVVH